MSIYADMYVTYMTYMTEYRSLWSHMGQQWVTCGLCESDMGQQWVPTWIIFGSYESYMDQPWYICRSHGSYMDYMWVKYGSTMVCIGQMVIYSIYGSTIGHIRVMVLCGIMEYRNNEPS